jgi:WD40 repeat protein
VNSVCFSPDGRYALSGSGDDTLRLWDVETAKSCGNLKDIRAGSVYSVCFSPDGRFALSGSLDKTLKLWEFDWDWEFP